MSHSPAPLTADVNAMLWGQFHLRGGWSRLVLFVGLYAAAAGGVVALSVVAGNAMPAAIKVLLVTIQGAILVLFAGARVATAIRQDLNTRMIDSHRMMPMSPAQAVVGYLVGAAAQPLALAAANLVLGVVVSAAVGTPAALWLTANAVLAGFAAFAVVAMAY